MTQKMKLIALSLSFFVLIASAETFKKVDYYYQQEGKEKPQEIGGSIATDPVAKSLRFQSKKMTVDIPAASITKIVYERASKPRYAAGLLLAWPLLFTKSKKHYLTVQYADAAGQGKFEIVRLDKDNVTTALAALEADTGIRIQRTEER